MKNHYSHAFLSLPICLILLSYGLPSDAHGSRPQDRPHFEELDQLADIVRSHANEHETEKAYAASKALEARAREVDDPHWIRIALSRQASHYFDLGDTERATELDLQVLHYLGLQEELEDRRLWALSSITYTNIITGYKTQGRMGEAYRIHRQFEDHQVEFFLKFWDVDLRPAPPFLMLATGARFWHNSYLDHEAGFRFSAGDTEDALAIQAGYIERMESDRNRSAGRLSSAYGHQVSRLEGVGRYEEAAVFSEKLLAMEDNPSTSFELNRERVRSAYRRIRQGEPPPPLLRQAEEALEVMKERNHLLARLASTGDIARIHFRMGDTNESLRLLDEVIEETRGYTLERLLARLLLTRAEILLNSGAGFRAEADLIEALTLLRQQGEWRREVEGYALYSRYLLAQNRMDEAREITGRGIFLARKFEEPLRLKTLLEIQAEITDRIRLPREAEAPPAFTACWTDLQPVRMVTEVRPDEYARGRFVVTNPGPHPIEGKITVTGGIGEYAWNATRDILDVEVDSTSSTPTIEQLVTIPSGGERILYLHASPADGADGGTASIEWMGNERQTAFWEFSLRETTAAVSIVTANLSMENAFYSVPMYQEMYYRGDAPIRQSIRVRTSHTSRVEIVDHLSGDLLAVDSTGDGDFTGPGDVIFRDVQRDGYPDIALDPANDIAALLLFVFPREDIDASEELIVQVDILEEGQWRPAGKNHFIPISRTIQ